MTDTVDIQLKSFTELMMAYDHSQAYLNRARERFLKDESQIEQLQKKGKEIDGEDRYQQQYLLREGDYEKYKYKGEPLFDALYKIISDTTNKNEPLDYDIDGFLKMDPESRAQNYKELVREIRERRVQENENLDKKE